jgi:hypothetical protein
MEALVILTAAAAIGWATWYFRTPNRIKRQLRATRVWEIGELPENAVGRVIGEVRALDRVLEAPLTGRACVYYVTKVEEQRSTGRGSTWTTLIKERAGVPFLLDDGSGRAIVDPEGAEVALELDSRSRSGTFDDASPAEEAFLERHGRSSKGFLFNKTIRYTEAVIKPGESISVLGSGVREPDPQGTPAEGYRAEPPTRLRLTSSHQHPLVISDDPDDAPALSPALRPVSSSRA